MLTPHIKHIIIFLDHPLLPDFFLDQKPEDLARQMEEHGELWGINSTFSFISKHTSADVSVSANILSLSSGATPAFKSADLPPQDLFLTCSTQSEEFSVQI